MFFIAHRGNINGPNPSQENHPTYLKTALSAGFCIECDVWYLQQDGFYLGHDLPQYKIADFNLSTEFFENPRVFVHCKNLAALYQLLPKNVNCFFHDHDDFTLTSKKNIWTFPGKPISPASICVMPERTEYTINQLKSCVGICTDYPRKYMDILGIKEEEPSLQLVKSAATDPIKVIEEFIGFYNNIAKIYEFTDETLKTELTSQLTRFWTTLADPLFVMNQMNHLVFELLRLCPFYHMLSWMCDINVLQYFERVQNQSHNFIKTMLLYSPLHNIEIDFDQFYAIQPALTSYWVSTMARYTELFNAKRNTGAILNKLVIAGVTDKYLPFIGYPYFYSTYINDTEASRIVKRQINQNIQAMYDRQNIIVHNRPKTRMIDGVSRYVMAIVANHECLGVGHPVFKYAKEHFDTFRELFHLELYFTEQWMPAEGSVERKHLEYYFGDRIYQFSITGDVSFADWTKFHDRWNNRDTLLAIPNMDKLLNNDYLAVYFLTMGISIESIWLSNLQLAPLQMSGYGHPISSYGSRNNYFIASGEVETNWSLKNCYSEEPILLNGVAAKPVIPPKQPLTATYPLDEPVQIMISWTFKKTNPVMLDALLAIQAASKKKIRFHFTVGPGSWFPCYKNIIEKIVAEYGFLDYQIHISNKSYADYLALKAACHLSLDCYPYAGFTTIYENLTQGLPTIVLEGKEAVNRMPGTILKGFNLGECVAYSHEQYVELAVRMINDVEYWGSVCKRIADIDFDRDMLSVRDPLSKWLSHFIDQYNATMALVSSA